MQVRRSHGLLALVGVLVAANAWLYYSVFHTKELSIVVLPVVSGSAVLVESPRGRTLLIDFGGDASILRALGNALPFWQRSLDVAIKTSASSKASGGLPDVVRRYQIQKFLVPAAVRRGDRIDLGGGAYADILWPDRDASSLSSTDGAVALTIHYGSTSFLFAQNLSPKVRAWINQLDATDGELAGTEIATTTPGGVVYVSNGEVVKLR